MARWCLFLVAVSGLAVLSHGSVPGNPFQVLNNVMRRMRAEFERSAFHERAHQMHRFKEHVGRIVQVHLFIGTRGAAPPPAVQAKLRALMMGGMEQMERHMLELAQSVRDNLGERKEHLLVKKVRQHCNRHIAMRRQRMMRRLKEKPKKQFIASSGRWTETEARRACHRLGGHLAVINGNEERRAALREVLRAERGRYFINLVGPHNRHVLAIYHAFTRPLGRSRSCAVLDPSRKSPVLIRCEEKAGALCEFLTFNPFLHHIGRKGFFTTYKRLTFDENKRLCEKSGGRVATIQNAEDQKWAKRNNTNGPAFIDLRRGRLGNESVWQMASRPLRWSNFRNNGNKGQRFDCIAMARDGLWDSVPCNRRLPALCEARVIHDDKVGAEDRLNDGKYFVAVNGPTDKFSRADAKWQCMKMDGVLARIRSNSQQVAALVAMKHGLPVHLDSLTFDSHNWYRWSDDTRLPKTQEWRLAYQNSTSALSMDKFGVWSTKEGLMGYLCEIPYRHTGDLDEGHYKFETDISMDIDFDVATASPPSEAQFVRALQAEVKEKCKAKGITIYSAVVVKMKPGSTVATVRVFSSGSGREEANALQEAIDSGNFYIIFKGRKVRPTPGQKLNIQFTIAICFGPITVHRRTLYAAIPGAVAVFAILVIITLVLMMKKRKRRQNRIDSIFTVKHEKELYAEEEKKGALCNHVDPPPPYPCSLTADAPPDYDSVLANEQKI